VLIMLTAIANHTSGTGLEFVDLKEEQKSLID
jgi:hypothetical protein